MRMRKRDLTYAKKRPTTMSTVGKCTQVSEKNSHSRKKT